MQEAPTGINEGLKDYSAAGIIFVPQTKIVENTTPIPIMMDLEDIAEFDVDMGDSELF